MKRSIARLACASVVSSATCATMLVAIPAAASELDGISSELSGTITQDGTPVANADIQVSLWPAPDELESLPEGGEVKMLPVSAEVSAADGTYSVDLPDSYIPSSYHYGNDSRLDLQVTVATASDQSVWNLTIKPAMSVDQGAPAGKWIDASVTDPSLAVNGPTPTLSANFGTGSSGSGATLQSSSIEESPEGFEGTDFTDEPARLRG